MTDSEQISVLDKPRYDLSTFWGRFRHFLDITDMRTLFTTSDKLNEALQMLKDYEERRIIPPGGEEELYQAKKIKDAIIHPDTGEKIPLLLRPSAFVPANVAIAAGMLSPTSTTLSQVFWQWVNQSYNTAFNHANRNASNKMTTSDIAKSYAAACAVSCGLALGLTEGFKRMTFLSPGLRSFFKVLVPFTAVASANYSNVILMRRNEAVNGIEIKDKYGVVHGKSKKAGKVALNQVAISRILIPVPVMIVPPTILWFLNKTTLLKQRPRLAIPINLALITGCLFTGLPAAVALFPPVASLPAEKLEPEFHNLRDQNGELITTFYFNKGV